MPRALCFMFETRVCVDKDVALLAGVATQLITPHQQLLVSRIDAVLLPRLSSQGLLATTREGMKQRQQAEETFCARL